MQKLVLTMLDTSGIQAYIFNSNRLQENIGASELVYRATTLWAFDELHQVTGGSHNIQQPGKLNWEYDPNALIEKDDGPAAEVVYAGGGNTFVIFREKETALQFTGQLTRRILRDAPNLTVVAQHLEFEWGKDELRDKRKALLQKLAQHKQSRQPSLPLLGLSVSAVCQSTGLPAVRNDTGKITIEREEISLRLKGQEADPPRLLSRETVAKIGWRDASNRRLRKELGNYDFTFNIDNLGRIKGEESYVAVVHADGNRMSEHLNAATQNATTPREVITALRNFSTNINTASLEALKHVVQLVDKAIQDPESEIPHEGDILPFRPLVFGGDDVTFLCNGQIGVSAAVAYLEAFERETAKLGFKDMHARAGITIVKMHYPFARAYKLSEELAGSAKRFIKTDTAADCSAFDWHYASGGLSGELKVIREREYEVKEGLLTMRPLALERGDKESNRRYWHNGIERVVHEFKYKWKERKNKVVGLREPLRKGADHVATYCRNFELGPLPALPGTNAQETGWHDGRCVYFDAVELFDHYLPLEKQEVPA